LLTSSPSAGPPDGPAYELNRTGHIHIHPTAGSMDAKVYDGKQISSVHLQEGAPSPADLNQHQSDYENHYAENGVRSVMVDSNNIYLYNSDDKQTIVIPRPR
jgi:hypothetical protein